MAGQLKAVRAQIAGLTIAIATTVIVPPNDSAKTATPRRLNFSESLLGTNCDTSLKYQLGPMV